MNTDYDEVPYESFPYHQTHPDNLYVMGKLHGLNPPNYKTAKVLELGCAMGGNLISFAYMFPGSVCHGIDLSYVQIEKAQKMIDDLELTNITVECKSIDDFTKEDGEYDYIICHGIMSWVPDATSNHILRIMNENLSENGMAQLSYNCRPGWDHIQPVMDMLKYTSEKHPEKEVNKQFAVDFLNMGVSLSKTNVTGVISKQELGIISKTNASYVMHEHMSSNNHAYYIKDMFKNLNEHNLTYLCEVCPNEAQQLNTDEFDMDFEEKMQMIDYFVCRRFRSSVIVKSSNFKDREIRKDFIKNLYVRCSIGVLDPAIKIGSPIATFTSLNKPNFAIEGVIRVACCLELVKNVFNCVHFSELVDCTHINLFEFDSDIGRDQVVNEFLDLLSYFMIINKGIISFHHSHPGTPKKIGATPMVDPYCQYQLSIGQNWVTNRYRKIVHIEPLVAKIVHLFDGKTQLVNIIGIVCKDYMAGNVEKTKLLLELTTKFLLSEFLLIDNL